MVAAWCIALTAKTCISSQYPSSPQRRSNGPPYNVGKICRENRDVLIETEQEIAGHRRLRGLQSPQN
jgi:hypothetical protein